MQIPSGHTPDSPEKLVTLCPCDQLHGARSGKWREPECHVFQHLDKNAPKTEHHHAAESRLVFGTQDDLLTGGFVLCHEEAGLFSGKLPTGILPDHSG